MTEQPPTPAAGDEGPDDVAEDTTAPDSGDPQPFPDSEAQDPDGTEDPGA